MIAFHGEGSHSGWGSQSINGCVTADQQNEIGLWKL